VNTFALEPIR